MYDPSYDQPRHMRGPAKIADELEIEVRRLRELAEREKDVDECRSEPWPIPQC